MVKYIIYADDACCFSPSIAGLQDLFDVCYSFFYKNGIVFNSNKSRCMQFLPKSFHLTNVPVVRLCNETLNFSKKVKYLDVYLTKALTDDDNPAIRGTFLCLLMPVPSPDNWGGLRQEGHPA